MMTAGGVATSEKRLGLAVFLHEFRILPNM